MNRKVSQKSIRKLVRLGKTSLAITIPKDLLLAFSWREKQKLVVKKVRGGIIVKDWKK